MEKHKFEIRFMREGITHIQTWGDWYDCICTGRIYSHDDGDKVTIVGCYAKPDDIGYKGVREEIVINKAALLIGLARALKRERSEGLENDKWCVILFEEIPDGEVNYSKLAEECADMHAEDIKQIFYAIEYL